MTGTPSRYALSTGSGKDATLALHRARADGLTVTTAFTIYDGETDRVAFHGTRVELVRAYCEALELEPVLVPSFPDRYEDAFAEALERLDGRGVEGVVFGNIHLADVRAWYEERTTAAGFVHEEPLWDGRPSELVRDFIAQGYRAVVVSVDLERGDPDWVGRELTLPLVEEIEARGADPCGERGEYHTFVFDGPDFHRPLRIEQGETVEMHGHRLVDLTLK